jgi:hypothetical protein
MANYVTVAFTAVGPFTWEVPAGVSEVEVLVVAGGGGGGGGRGGNVVPSGGGGAGELVYRAAYSVTPGVGIAGVVGAGGAGGDGANEINSHPGQNSTFGSLAAIGGGAGSQNSTDEPDGGSGGGARGSNVPGGQSLAVDGVGNNGGAGYFESGVAFAAGGGGGAGSPGADANYSGNGGNGGNGVDYGSVFGAEYGDAGWFAGGGGGGTYSNSSSVSGGVGGAGGAGGGGVGGGSQDNLFNDHGAAAIPGSGGGGGGGATRHAADTPSKGGDGGSGIVLIRYATPLFASPDWDVATSSFTLSVEWVAITGATEYRLRLLDASLALIEEITTTGLTHTITGLAAETTYHLELTGLDGSTELETLTLEVTTPEAVSSLVMLMEFVQNVRRHLPARDILVLDQYVVTRSQPERTLLELTQRVTVFVETGQRQLLAIEQDVKRPLPARQLLRLRQNVRAPATSVPSPGPQPAPDPITMILLDDQDITSFCSMAFQVSASEGDNRTCVVDYYPPSGPINITSFQGRALEIRRLISGQWVALFVGWVDVPTYVREERTLQLRGSDLRSERMGRENRDMLKALTGGLVSPITQREDASGEAWVRELLKTVEGSLDYTSAGSLRFRPWAVASPRYTLTGGQIHHRQVAMEFATRSQIVNRVTATIEYRWYRKRAFAAVSSVSVPSSALCRNLNRECIPAAGYSLPTKESIVNRLGTSLGGWRVVGVSTSSPPGSGWYRSSPFSTPVAYITNENFRNTYATGGSLQLARWVSQAQRNVYNLSVTAPQSEDQFGSIEGSSMRFSLETNIDPSVFEQDGCSIGPDNDRAADFGLAKEVALRMALREIKGAHRQNYASFRYKPKGGRLLPIEIGDTVQVQADEVAVTGWVVEFKHETTIEGDQWTDVKLAVSRVDSPVAVEEGFTEPEPGDRFVMNPRSAGRSPDSLCAGNTEGSAFEGIDEGGVMTFVAPRISPADTDERVSTANRAYRAAIPVNPFEVNVP